MLFILTVAHFQAYSLTVEIKYPHTPVALDQFATINLFLTYPEGHHTDINILIENLFRNAALNPFPFLLNAPPKSSKTQQNGIIQEMISFQLQPELPGKHVLTFYNIPLFEDASKRLVDTFVSDLFTIEVASSNPSNQDLIPSPPLSLSPRLPVSLSQENAQEIRQTFYTPDALRKSENILQERSFPWRKIGLGLLGLFFGLLGWMLTRDKKITPKIEGQKIKESEIAFKTLIRGQLLEKGKFSQFINQLDNILKKHVQEETGINATQLTTDEILPHVSAEIGRFFVQADQVKFAKHQPTFEECQKAETMVDQLLHQHSK